MKLADYVMQFVARQGVKHVFMVPGGGAMHLNDALGRCRELEFVCNLHEQASAIAAEAYARVSGNLGVALVTTGPGSTNALTGVLGAWQDSIPVLFISGQVKRADMMTGLGVRQLGVQEADIVALVKTITKYAVTVLDPAMIRHHLEKAVHLARTGRPGPVWIDLPLDVQASQIEPEKLAAFQPVPQPAPGALAEWVAQARQWLDAAERPVLLAGNGIRLAGAQREFLALVERLGIPVLTTWPGMDLIADAHPLMIGRPGPLAPRGANFTLQNADWLLTIGARLDMALSAYAPKNLARAAKKIMVDVDAAEIRKLGEAIQLPVCCDAALFIKEFLRQSEKTAPRDHSAWLARCREWKTKYPVVLPEYRRPGRRVSTYYLTEVLSAELTADDLVVAGSSGLGIELFLLAFKPKLGQRVFCTTAMGAMGYGLPSTLGACLAGNRRRTVSVDGDGGFQLNIQELETLARLKLPIKLFVLNNNGFASIRLSQTRHFGRLTAADATSGLTLPDLVKVATAYGLATARIETQTDLPAQVRRVLAMPGPVVCDVWAEPNEERAPAIASRQTAGGTMVSTPLEDLWPFLDRGEFRANMLIPILDESAGGQA